MDPRVLAVCAVLAAGYLGYKKIEPPIKNHVIMPIVHVFHKPKPATVPPPETK